MPHLFAREKKLEADAGALQAAQGARQAAQGAQQAAEDAKKVEALMTGHDHCPVCKAVFEPDLGFCPACGAEK